MCFGLPATIWGVPLSPSVSSMGVLRGGWAWWLRGVGFLGNYLLIMIPPCHPLCHTIQRLHCCQRSHMYSCSARYSGTSPRSFHLVLRFTFMTTRFLGVHLIRYALAMSASFTCFNVCDSFCRFLPVAYCLGHECLVHMFHVLANL